MPPLWPCHPYLPLGDARSLTSQEKEWQDEPPSAPLQWRPFPLFPGQVVDHEDDVLVLVVVLLFLFLCVEV